MISLTALIIAIIAGLNAIYALFIYVMYLSSIGGAKLSKKVGTDNSRTDENIAKGKVQSKAHLRSFVIRAVITIVAFGVYYFYK